MMIVRQFSMPFARTLVAWRRIWRTRATKLRSTHTCKGFVQKEHDLTLGAPWFQRGFDDGEAFDVLLTLVPGLGEEIDRENRSYRLVRVWHQPVNYEGRARFGWHAMV